MSGSISRREFVNGALAAAVAGGIAMNGTAGRAVEPGKPNILLILTDQQSATMLSATGNRWVRTPNLDRLAASGMRFERAYTTNPVCIPARFGIITGTMPSVVGEANEDIWHAPVPDAILADSMGHLFRNAGYRTVYGGKVHLPGPLGIREKVEPYGFENIAGDDGAGRDGLANACVKFLSEKHDKPFLLYASFINPHDICYMAINEFKKANGKAPGNGIQDRELAAALQLPPDMAEPDFFRSVCPPLPDNFEPPCGELSSVMDDKPDFMKYARNRWDERMWRMHRFAYARLTERVDAQVGRVLDALRDSGLAENTLVVFTSDHGEMDGAHRVDEKAFPYEECMRVPFIVSWQGKIEPGVDRDHLVSSGLDLIPTLCDYAGIAVPRSCGGKSVRLIIEGRSRTWPDHLVVENHLSRIVLMRRWKYAVTRAERHHDAVCRKCQSDVPSYNPALRESLFDLATDPGEMKNRAGEPSCLEHLLEGRRLLAAWYRERGFNLDPAYIVSGAKL